jgi:hypothetical protein
MENKDLVQPIAAETPLKQMVVNYIGDRLEAEDPDVTVQMAVDVFAAEFPEFLLAVAEENFLRGYEQAMEDVFPERLETQKEITTPPE